LPQQIPYFFEQPEELFALDDHRVFFLERREYGNFAVIEIEPGNAADIQCFRQMSLPLGF